MKRIAIAIVFISLGTVFLSAQTPPKANKTGVKWGMSVDDLLLYNTDKVNYDSSFMRESQTKFNTAEVRIISVEKTFWGEKFGKRYEFEDDELIHLSITKIDEPKFPFFDYRNYTIEFSNALITKYGQSTKTQNGKLIMDLDDLADIKYEKLNFSFVRTWNLDNEKIILTFDNTPYAYENIIGWSIEYFSNEIEKKIELKKVTHEMNILQREERKKKEELANVMNEL